MTNQIDDKDDDLLTNVVEPDENEWKKFVDEYVHFIIYLSFLFIYYRMKYVRALEYVLQNAPIRAKDPEKKVIYNSINFECFQDNDYSDRDDQKR
jgi:hypothetical protein